MQERNIDSKLYEKFLGTGQEAVRLDCALKGYFQDETESGPESECSGKEREAYAAYLKRRIRPAAQRLIDLHECGKIRQLVKLGWIHSRELDDLITYALARRCEAEVLDLLLIKDRAFGFRDREFLL